MSSNTQSKERKKNPLAFLFPLACCLLFCLTGCVNYDVGVNFKSPHDGNIVQHITVSSQIDNLDRSDIKKWLNSVESRARQLQGKIKKIAPSEIIVTVPFHNSQEFATKFNLLFHSEIPVTSAVSTGENPELTKLDSRIELEQSNLILLERNSIDLAIDLRALNILSHQGKIAIESDRLIDLDLSLNTPWIAYSVSGEEYLQPKSNSLKKQLVWHLQPGKINHIKAVFFLPSPLGIGALIIIILMVSGFYLKYRRLPGFQS